MYKGKKRKVLQITVNTIEFYKYSKFTKSEGFLYHYKKRASHEWKNGKMKRFHGMDRARGYGLKSMQTQAKLTALAVNLKRIASLLSSGFYATRDYFSYLLCTIVKPKNHLPDNS